MIKSLKLPADILDPVLGTDAPQPSEGLSCEVTERLPNPCTEQRPFASPSTSRNHEMSIHAEEDSEQHTPEGGTTGSCSKLECDTAHSEALDPLKSLLIPQENRSDGPKVKSIPGCKVLAQVWLTYVRGD